jgi:SAM-dependent methyltransferase
MTDDRLEMFVQRYQNADVPWDTGITPPEIVRVVKELTPGKALDIGCGTGTNVRYLLERGWQAVGTSGSADMVLSTLRLI